MPIWWHQALPEIRCTPAQQEDDYALAKMSGLDDEELARRLQEQERAFLMFRRCAG